MEEKGESGTQKETWSWEGGEPSLEVASVGRLETASGECGAKAQPVVPGVRLALSGDRAGVEDVASAQHLRLMGLAHGYRKDYSAERPAELAQTRSSLSKCDAAKMIADEMNGFGVYAMPGWCVVAAREISFMRSRVRAAALTETEPDRSFSDTSGEWEGAPPAMQGGYSPMTEDEGSWSPKSDATARNSRGNRSRDLALEMQKAECKEGSAFEGVGCIEERDQVCVADAAGALDEHVAELEEEERVRAESLREATQIFVANGGFGRQDGGSAEGAGLEPEKPPVVKDRDEAERCDREQEEVEESFREHVAQTLRSSDVLLAAELHQMEVMKPVEARKLESLKRTRETNAAFPALGTTVDVTKVELQLGRRQLASRKREQREGGDPLKRVSANTDNKKRVKIPSLNRKPGMPDLSQGQDFNQAMRSYSAALQRSQGDYGKAARSGTEWGVVPRGAARRKGVGGEF
jgi:hypothetical protein